MKSSPQRSLRIGEIVRHALCDLFLRTSFYEPELRDVTITVTEVQVSPDLRFATVFIVPLGGKNLESVCLGLKRLAPFFRARLGQAVHLRYIPHLSFKSDHSFDHAHRIEALIQRIHEDTNPSSLER